MGTYFLLYPAYGLYNKAILGFNMEKLIRVQELVDVDCVISIEYKIGKS